MGSTLFESSIVYIRDEPRNVDATKFCGPIILCEVSRSIQLTTDTTIQQRKLDFCELYTL